MKIIKNKFKNVINNVSNSFLIFFFIWLKFRKLNLLKYRLKKKNNYTVFASILLVDKCFNYFS